ncbi:DUF5107 domain-containing protein [Oscillospiraceae bacterium PP1C4]
MIKNIDKGVAVWEQEVVIPTYPVGAPDKNPMFLEKRVYQGSSGKVYPHSVIDKIYDEKVDKTYKAIFLENKYLHVMILPELGGRIQRALDKTNNYDFVYYNHVIKPALVGLNGPWISGGIEFNWPQHHRPSTYDPIAYKMVENPDGSCSVVVNEIENMFRTKGMASFTLYPDKSYIEIKAQLYNRTDVPQTFLWWANPAIPVNDDAQSVFPPDVNAVMDHGKRDVSKFPIATGTYYKQDYSQGVDISRYKNIPVPTSYMAYHSDYNFVGGYDHGRQAGILHVADHHVSPGKKQWTWGCGDFGQAWDRNLTDEDGPYVELMTGCFTDNQPDFTWMAPYEEKVFTQYFMPYKQVGMIKNATIDAAVNLELSGNNVTAVAYATSAFENAKVIIKAKGEIRLEKTMLLSPTDIFEASVQVVDGIKESALSIEVYDCCGNLLVDYTPKEKGIEKIPEPAKAAPAPQDAATTEDLYLYGQHLEQYRHATYEPADYYKEGLHRDPSDIRLNNAYGSLLMRRGLFATAQPYFEAAVKKLTRSNPNPYDGEPLYNLGLCLRYQGKLASAYDAFYKATWNDAWQGSSFYQLACIAAINHDYAVALEHIERALIKNSHNMKARTLKTALLRNSGKTEEAKAYAHESLTIDVMDLAARYELDDMAGLLELMGGNHNNTIEVALEYSTAGLYHDAAALLSAFAQSIEDNHAVYPMVFYYLAYNYARMNDRVNVEHHLQLAANACSDYCFPHRLEDILVLERAIDLNPKDAKAPYYLGCLWYDKKQYEQAISRWEQSEALDSGFPTVHRNLALAYFNKLGDRQRAAVQMETAFQLNMTDSRVFMELDQLYKKLGRKPAERLAIFDQNIDVVRDRDDLYLEYITLKNFTGDYQAALELIAARKFHPWEGGEGKVPAQYIYCRVELAKQAIAMQNYAKAVLLLQEATVYPHNLGEGKLAGAQENNIYYYMGCAYEGMGDTKKAADCFEKASQGLTEPAGMMYYNDQPPETIFYQGLAMRKLGHEDKARSRFNKLIGYGEKHIYDDVKIEYFAVSLPDLQIFDEDLCRKNRIHCLYMMGLGHLGLGESEIAQSELSEAASLDVNHMGVNLHRGMLI